MQGGRGTALQIRGLPTRARAESYGVPPRAASLAASNSSPGFHVGIASANHDEGAFDDPDGFDIGRQPNRHLAFGHGIHTCAGNSLARMEGRLAFLKLLDRFGTIEQTGPTIRPPRARFRVVSELPVRLAA